jgi:protein-L-isoaspartate(D-aspartate) O-methyltransferase
VTDSSKPRGKFPANLQAVGANTRHKRDVLRPQRPLAEAVRDARQVSIPTGIGLDNQAMRSRMVERLRRDGVHCVPVLQAMEKLPRHRFVDSALAAQAYEDTSLPIGLGQTISKPSVVARMVEWLFLGEAARNAGNLGRVLEIGTGCGYQTALLSECASHVVSMERLRPLHEMAKRYLDEMQTPRIQLMYGDGMLGHAPLAPYDSIIAAAGGDEIPEAWLQQLAVGGRMIAPARSPNGKGQVLVIVDRSINGLQRTVGETVQFVPLKSGTN